jgi:hypothetical protein
LNPITASLVAVRPGSAKGMIGASASAGPAAAPAERGRRSDSSGKVYFAAIVVLNAIMREGATPRGCDS